MFALASKQPGVCRSLSLCVYPDLQSCNNPRPANSAAIRLNLSYQGLGTEYQAIFPALPCHTATSASTAALACDRCTQMHLV